MAESHTGGNEPGPAESWYLKIDDGTVFGPADHDELIEWAEQGRIAPGNRVSQDQKQWIVAESLPWLRMEWKVELANGTFYGPLNRRAVDSLIADGTVAPSAKIVRAGSEPRSSSGGAEKDPPRAPAADAPAKDADGKAPRARTGAAAKPDDTAADQKPLSYLRSRRLAGQAAAAGGGRRREQELEEEVQALQKRLTNSSALAEQAQKELEYERKQHAYTREEVKQRKAELAMRVELLTKQIQASDEKLRQAEEELAKRTDSYRTLQTQEAARERELEDQIDQLRRSLADAEAGTAEVQAAVEQEKQRASEQTRKAEREKEEVAARLKDTSKRLQQTEKDLADQRKAAEELRRQLDAQKAQLAQAQAGEDALKEELAAAHRKQTELGEQIAELERTVEEADAELGRLDRELQAERERAEELQREKDARDHEEIKQTDLFKQILVQELHKVEDGLEEEMALFDSLREASVKRQEAIQNRILAFHELIGSDLEKQKELFAKRQRALDELAEMREEVDGEREARRREIKQLQDHEAELQRQIDLLRHKDEDNQEKLSQLDALRNELQTARAEIRRKERNLDQEKRSHGDEIARWKQKEQTLTSRIEQIQRESKAVASRMEQAQKELMQKKRRTPGTQAAGSAPAAAKKPAAAPGARPAPKPEPAPEPKAAPKKVAAKPSPSPGTKERKEKPDTGKSGDNNFEASSWLKSE